MLKLWEAEIWGRSDWDFVRCSKPPFFPKTFCFNLLPDPLSESSRQVQESVCSSACVARALWAVKTIQGHGLARCGGCRPVSPAARGLYRLCAGILFPRPYGLYRQRCPRTCPTAPGRARQLWRTCSFSGSHFSNSCAV